MQYWKLIFKTVIQTKQTEYLSHSFVRTLWIHEDSEYKCFGTFLDVKVFFKKIFGWHRQNFLILLTDYFTVLTSNLDKKINTKQGSTNAYIMVRVDWGSFSWSIVMCKRCNPNIENLKISLVEYSHFVNIFIIEWCPIIQQEHRSLMRLHIPGEELTIHFTGAWIKYCAFEELGFYV